MSESDITKRVFLFQFFEGVGGLFIIGLSTGIKRCMSQTISRPMLILQHNKNYFFMGTH